VKHTYLLRSTEAVLKWLKTAKQGARYLYFVGDLLAARWEGTESPSGATPEAKAANATAELAWNLHQEGVLELAQVRLDDGVRAYFIYFNDKDNGIALSNE
jgi:UDP-2,3-diacylglucosamine pyrophosphatase LpxH